MRAAVVAALLAALASSAHANTRSFALISGGIVTDVWTITTPDAAAPPNAAGWVDVTGDSPFPQPGWSATQTGGVWSFATPPPPNVISSAVFQARFTLAEQAAIWAAAVASPQIGVGLQQGITAGEIDLTGCPSACTNALLKTWMDGLVSAGAIASARETTILTP